MLDAAITQLRPGYGALIAEYRRLQENKTRILRDWREKPSLLDTLDVFSDGMCMCSAKIIRYRASFARRLAETARSVQSEFSRGTEDLTLTYTTVSAVEDPAAAEREIYEAVSERQHQLRGAEIESGLCLVGAHKDDLLITINGADARSYASQGQTRTAALSLKLAEREIFLAETGAGAAARRRFVRARQRPAGVCFEPHRRRTDARELLRGGERRAHDGRSRTLYGQRTGKRSMYLHLGAETVVRTDSIVAVCDLDNASSSHITRETLRAAEKAGKVVNVADDLPKSFVVCREDGKTRIYLSQLNTATLLKRAENISFD